MDASLIFDLYGVSTPIETMNQFGLSVANDSHGKLIIPMVLPVCRTRQSAYRLASWLVLLAEATELPHEPGRHTIEEIAQAIRNT